MTDLDAKEVGLQGAMSSQTDMHLKAFKDLGYEIGLCFSTTSGHIMKVIEIIDRGPQDSPSSIGHVEWTKLEEF